MRTLVERGSVHRFPEDIRLHRTTVSHLSNQAAATVVWVDGVAVGALTRQHAAATHRRARRRAGSVGTKLNVRHHHGNVTAASNRAI